MEQKQGPVFPGVSGEQLEQIRQRAQDGQSVRRIAEMVGLSKSSVSRVVAHYGWGAATTLGKDGRRRKRRLSAQGECGLESCSDPNCERHEAPAEPSRDVGCWACGRRGWMRNGTGWVRCSVCTGAGWLYEYEPDTFPSNRYGATWVASVREEYEQSGYSVTATATAWEREADWRAVNSLDGVGRTRVSRESTVAGHRWRTAELHGVGGE